MAPSGGGSATTGASEAGSTVTISTTTPHGYNIGQTVTVSGVGVGTVSLIGDTGATEAGMIGLAGHRSVGGVRASLYNALSQEACAALAGYMGEFARTHG